MSCAECMHVADLHAMDFVVSLHGFTYCSLLKRVHMVGVETFWTLHKGRHISLIKTNAALERERDPVTDGMFEMDEEVSDFAGVLFADTQTETLVS